MRDLDGQQVRLEAYLREWARWRASWRPAIGYPSSSHVFASGGRGHDNARDWLAESDGWAMDTLDTAIDSLTPIQRLVLDIEFTNQEFGRVFGSMRLPQDPADLAALIDEAIFALLPIVMRAGLPL